MKFMLAGDGTGTLSLLDPSQIVGVVETKIFKGLNDPPEIVAVILLKSGKEFTVVDGLPRRVLQSILQVASDKTDTPRVVEGD